MARVKDGILLKLDGNPYHPNNFDPDERLPFSTSIDQAKRKPARLCAKGQAGVLVVYDPYRIKQPLKRVGPRGSGKWKAITWDQAFEEIAAKLKPLRNFETLIDPAAPELGPIANQVLYSPGRTIEGGFTDRIWKNGFGTINSPGGSYQHLRDVAPRRQRADDLGRKDKSRAQEPFQARHRRVQVHHAVRLQFSGGEFPDGRPCPQDDGFQGKGRKVRRRRSALLQHRGASRSLGPDQARH